MHAYWLLTRGSSFEQSDGSDVAADSDGESSGGSSPFDALFAAWIEREEERRYATDDEQSYEDRAPDRDRAPDDNCEGADDRLSDYYPEEDDCSIDLSVE